jgi:hypothetical protein
MVYHLLRSKEATMRRFALVLLSVCFLFAAVSLEARPGFGGTYNVIGTNPGVGAYRGVLTITPRGEVYDVRWTIAKLSYYGVGIVVNDTLSVAYTDSNHTFFGIASYARSGGSLDGRWAVAGGPAVTGTEIATPRR